MQSTPDANSTGAESLMDRASAAALPLPTFAGSCRRAVTRAPTIERRSHRHFVVFGSLSHTVADAVEVQFQAAQITAKRVWLCRPAIGQGAEFSAARWTEPRHQVRTT